MNVGTQRRRIGVAQAEVKVVVNSKSAQILFEVMVMIKLSKLAVLYPSVLFFRGLFCALSGETRYW